MAEAVGSLRFQANESHDSTETGSISVSDQERARDDDISFD